MTMMRTAALLTIVLAAPAAAQHQHQAGHEHQAGHQHEHQRAQNDSAFHALQQRGRIAMGVDQYTSTHVFEDRPDGGRIELQRNVDDAEGVKTIRKHLREIADIFAKGDFSTPAFVHMQEVPGTKVMASKRAVITYTFRELPRGAEVRIRTKDPDAINAVHAFLEFQRTDHRAEGH